MTSSEMHNLVHVMGDIDSLNDLYAEITWAMENLDNFNPFPPQFLVIEDGRGVMEFIFYTPDELDKVHNLISKMSIQHPTLLFSLSSTVGDKTTDIAFVNGQVG